MTEGLRAELAARGYAVVRGRDDLREAATSPWTFAERLLGARPEMLEQQPIRAVPGGRSFASTRGFTPLHSDSQLHLGAPPDAQVMACHQHAAHGGETLLLDTWALLDDLQRDDPALLQALFEVPRRIPFVFGDVYGPTVSLRGGALCFTHSPMAPAPDPLSQALDARLRAHATVVVAVRAGEVLVVDNRRMLHGRRGFDDTARSFTRLLAWLPAPLAEHPGYTAAARAVRAPDLLADESDPRVRARFGALEPTSSRARARLQTVLAMLRGVAPGVLAHHTGVPEPVLYQWRDAALRGALRSLEETDAVDVSPDCDARLGGS